MKPSIQLLRLCAELSAASYLEAPVLPETSLLGGKVHWVPFSDQATDTQGFILVSDAYIFIVFRGTKGFEDIRTDLKLKRIPFEFKGTTIGKVHRGFLTAYTSVHRRIVELLQEIFKWANRRAEVVICGHSLGGALAQLCAVSLRMESFQIDHVITFGSPRVGNADFAADYNLLLGECSVRVVNCLDAIPRLPSWFTGNRHGGLTELFFDAFGRHTINPDPLYRFASSAYRIWLDCHEMTWMQVTAYLKLPIPSGISAAENHFMKNYAQKLETLEVSSV